MIKCFTFENFKSFEKAELDIEALTTLIGTNSSGKSNAIEGIAILAKAATGIELSTILDGTKSTGAVVRGGSRGCARFKTNAFKLGCLIDLNDKKDLLYEIKIGVGDRVAIEEEGLYLVKKDTLGPKSNKIFKTKKVESGRAEIKVQYKNGSRGNDPDMICVRSSAILSQMVGKMRRDTEEERETVVWMERVINHLKNIRMMDPIPSEIREYARISDIELRQNCDNLSAVLNEMCKDSSKKEQLLKVVRELPENDIEDIEFVETKIGDVIFALRERNLNSTELVDARQLSDGTLRCIAVLTAALIGEPGSMVMIEELDNGIHPARVYKLVEQLIAIGTERNIDVIITTHNATLLNSYKKDELMGVSVVYRDKERGTSKIQSFIEIENFPSMLAAGGLGDAMIDESLLSALKQSKHAKDYSWLGV
ncbi:AAA family ATPase [Bariatricus sp. HCP28S3_A7]|uniref:AAA family ATPase n=1 Tax=Bariatricus sp. HCP28S3_A7 TaxID=3438894 RepID=UPI003F89E209